MQVLVGRALAPAHLTVEHPASRRGIPVLVVRGNAYSPYDAAVNLKLAAATRKERAALKAAGYYIPPEPWGDKLRRLRRKARLSQAELAEKLGTTQEAISLWESRFSPPRGKTVEKLREILGTEL